MSRIRMLAGETVLYGLGTILPRALNFLLVPLHTVNMFNRAEYGEVTKLLSIVAFVNVVYLFGMETAFFRFATKPEADSRRIFNLAQTCVVLVSAGISVILIVFSSPIAESLGVGSHPEFIMWLTLIMLTDAIVAIPFARLRLQKKALLFATAKVINVLLVIGLNFYFLKISYDSSVGIGYVFLAMMLSNLFYLPFFARSLASWRPAWDSFLSPEMIRYAYPVMLTGIAGMTNEMFSRLTLDWWLPENFYAGYSNEAALGIFGACYKFAVFMNLGIQAFRYAAEPFFFSNAADKNSPALFARVNHYFVIVGSFVLLAVSVNLDILKYFIGEAFWDGLAIVPVLLLAYLFLGIYYNVSIWFKLTDRTYFGTLITLGGAAVTIAANYALIPVWGYLGSSYAALVCYGLMTVVCYSFGQRYFPIPYRVMAGAAYILLAFLFIFISSQVVIKQPFLAFLFHSGLLLGFAAIAWIAERRNVAG